MPRVLMVPAAGAWSFAIDADQLPFTFAFPAGSKAGGITFTAVNGGGSTPINPQGAIGTIVVDGGAPDSTACLTNGSQTLAVAPGATSVLISVAYGCNAGPDTTVVTVSGVGA